MTLKPEINESGEKEKAAGNIPRKRKGGDRCLHVLIVSCWQFLIGFGEGKME